MDLYNKKDIKPMLLKEVFKAFNDPNYLFELKFDGVRALIYVDPNEITIKSRNNIILNTVFNELENIKKLVKHKCIFDGEIIALEKGKPSFKKILERLHLKDKYKIKEKSINEPVTFICFDILYDNKDITNLTLLERKTYLEKYTDCDSFIKSKYVLEKGKALFNFVKNENLEGIVAKKTNSTYQIGKRSDDWLKIKNKFEEIFYIAGYYIPEKGSLANLLLAKKLDNKYTYVGKVSIGKNNSFFNIILKEKTSSKSFLINFNDVNYCYLKPNLKCMIEYLSKSKDGLRQSIFKKLIS